MFTIEQYRGLDISILTQECRCDFGAVNVECFTWGNRATYHIADCRDRAYLA